MVRHSPLFVDQLEDRCVPSADPLAPDVVPPLVDTTAVVVETAPSTTETFVIDPYLIDPNDPGVAPKPADGGWTDPYVPPPESPVPPIGDPFWY
jgi:hypothetical protein